MDEPFSQQSTKFLLCDIAQMDDLFLDMFCGVFGVHMGDHFMIYYGRPILRSFWDEVLLVVFRSLPQQMGNHF